MNLKSEQNLTSEQEEKVNQIDRDFAAAGFGGFREAFARFAFSAKAASEAMERLGFVLPEYEPTLLDRVKWFCYDVIHKPLVIIFRFYRWLKKVVIEAWEDSE